MRPITSYNTFPNYILFVGIIVSILIGIQSYKSLLQKEQIKFDSISKKTVQNIENRMDTYREVLYGGIGLFKASQNSVSRQSWHKYVKELHLNEYYPGIQGVGYSIVLQERELEEHVKQIKSEGFQYYTIRPEGKRELYTSIIYLEPFDWRNQRAFGYDMYSNETRKEAMQRAIETTLPSLTAKVRLVQEDGKNEQAGFLLYLPLYKPDAPLETVKQRYEAIQGFVYAPFRVDNFMKGIIDDSFDLVQLQVYDGDTINEENLLFNSANNQATIKPFIYTAVIELEGRFWTVEIRALSSFISIDTMVYPFIFSLLALFITLLIYLAVKRQNETLKLKDELLFGISQGIIVTDKHRNVIYTNKAFEKITGYSSEYMLGKNPDILQGEMTDKNTVEMIQHKLKALIPFEVEVLNYKKDGTPFWNRIAVTPIFDTKNQLERFIGIQDDITLKKEYEAKVLFQRNFLQNVLDNTHAIIAVIDSNGVMINLNKYGCDFVKYSLEEVSSQPWFWKRFLPLSKQEVVVKIVENANKGIITRNFQNSWISKDHEERMFDWSNTLVQKADGTMDFLVTIGIDITEKQMIEKLVLEQKEEFETIFNYSKEGIAIIDLKSNFLKFNKAYQELLDYKEEELLETSYLALTAPEDYERSKSMIETVINTGSVTNFEKTYLLKNDKRLKTNCSISLLPDKKRLLIVAKDVTEMKMQEEQARLASMGEMIGNIAHQWRQPLSVIASAASGTKLTKELNILEDYELSENMDLIVKEAKYLSETIDSFSNYIKGTKYFSNYKLREIIDESLQLMDIVFRNNFITVVLNIEEDGVIFVNKGQILQALLNIMKNAKDAVNELDPNQDKMVFINTIRQNDTHIVVEIFDNGNGIDERIIDRIYEPYFTTKHKSIGTGIGLNMTRKILVENHPFTLSAYNKEYTYNNHKYKGACFSITFEITQK